MGGRGLELVASSRPVFDGGAKTLTFTVPAAAKRGDLLVALAVRNGAIVAPAGWTQIETALGSSGVFLDAWARLVDLEEPAAAVWTSASSQELQGQLLVFGSGTPALVRETSAFLQGPASAGFNTPPVYSVQSQSLLLLVGSANAAVTWSALGLTLVDTYSTAVVSARSLGVSYIVAGEVDSGFTIGNNGPIEGGGMLCAPVADLYGFSLVLRERSPFPPAELADPVPGNIGLLPS